MNSELYTYTLQFDNDKYLITKRLYSEIIAETNLINDYNKCRSYVRGALMKCYREVKEVTRFDSKKIDIEL